MKKTKNKEQKTAAKKKSKKEPVKYDPFIREDIYEVIMKNVGWLRDACIKYAGIDEAPIEVWKKIDAMILEISERAFKKEVHGYYYHKEPMKRATYTISQRVREKWRKEQIVIWSGKMIEGDREWNEHCCYHIFLDCAIWLSENSKQEKASANKGDDEENVD